MTPYNLTPSSDLDYDGPGYRSPYTGNSARINTTSFVKIHPSDPGSNTRNMNYEFLEPILRHSIFDRGAFLLVPISLIAPDIIDLLEKLHHGSGVCRALTRDLPEPLTITKNDIVDGGVDRCMEFNKLFRKAIEVKAGSRFYGSTISGSSSNISSGVSTDSSLTLTNEPDKLKSSLFKVKMIKLKQE